MLAVPGRHDFLRRGIVGCVDATVSRIIGMDLALPPDPLISRMFSQTMGIAKRRRMNEQVAELRSRIDAAFPEDPAATNGLRIALSVLGRDALAGTVALSLRAHFDLLDGRSLSAMPLPEVPTQSGVPYVDRQARRAATIDGTEVAAGAHVRVNLAAYAGLPDAERLRFFGSGAHVCLGRPLSIALMAAISAHLSGLSTRVAVTGFALRKDDVFSIPDRFDIEVR